MTEHRIDFKEVVGLCHAAWIEAAYRETEMNTVSAQRIQRDWESSDILAKLHKLHNAHVEGEHADGRILFRNFSCTRCGIVFRDHSHPVCPSCSRDDQIERIVL